MSRQTRKGRRRGATRELPVPNPARANIEDRMTTDPNPPQPPLPPPNQPDPGAPPIPPPPGTQPVPADKAAEVEAAMALALGDGPDGM